MFAPPAFADHTRADTCQQAGGVFLDNGPGTSNDRCRFETRGTPVTAPSGAPMITQGETRNVGGSTFVDGPATPSGAPTVFRETRNVGDATTVETERLGTPTTTVEERDAGLATETFVIVPGTPMTSERTERGTPTTTSAPGTTNCRKVNDERSRQQVTKCDRTVVTTTTTPTTVFTTVTTPQERVTTRTQPRETVTTVTTPVTPVFTTLQRREQCVTTTQPTTFVRTTTQPREREQIVTTPQTTTTVVTTTFRSFNGGGPTAPLNAAPNPTETTTRTETAPAEPLVARTFLPIDPLITTETRAGEPIVTGPTCTATEPDITVTEGETMNREVKTITPADPDITMTTTTEEPLVVTTQRAGAPIVETSTRNTGESCVQNPSNSEQRRNAC